MKKIFLTMALAVGLMATAQVKIGTDVENINPASILELESSTQGVNFPKLALTSTTVAAPLLGDVHVAGMTVYNTATTGDVTPGLYSNNGAAWVKLGGTTPSYQNIGGGVQTLSASGTILDSTYFVLYTGLAAGTLAPPTAAAGKTFHVRTTSTGTASVAGLTVGTSKGRSFVSDGTSWYPLVP
jgi:hypothetical protein